MKKPLSEQVIVVTGASSGRGRAVARLAAERGAKVVVTARGTDGLDACVREIEAAYGVKIVNAHNVGIANLHATGAGDTVDAAALRVEGSTVYVRNSWLRTPYVSFSDQKAFEALTSTYLVVIGSFFDAGAPTHDGNSLSYCGGDYSRTAVLVTC